MPSPTDDTARTRSQVYVYEDGFMFACEGLAAPRTERFTATLLFATSDQGLDIEVGDGRHHAQVAVLKPFLPKTLHAAAQPFVSIGVNSAHPCYRAFTRPARIWGMIGGMVLKLVMTWPAMRSMAIGPPPL